MANYNERLSSNTPGPWYVDTSCIDCDLCRENAPTVFRRDDTIGFSIVYKQPETREEEEKAREAQAGCPVEAIGCEASLQPQ